MKHEVKMVIETNVDGLCALTTGEKEILLVNYFTKYPDSSAKEKLSNSIGKCVDLKVSDLSVDGITYKKGMIISSPTCFSNVELFNQIYLDTLEDKMLGMEDVGLDDYSNIVDYQLFTIWNTIPLKRDIFNKVKDFQSTIGKILLEYTNDKKWIYYLVDKDGRKIDIKYCSGSDILLPCLVALIGTKYEVYKEKMVVVLDDITYKYYVDTVSIDVKEYLDSLAVIVSNKNIEVATK